MTIATDLLDQNGFLKDPSAWTPDFAQQFAAQQNLVLQQEHWLVLHFAREFYDQYQYSPIQRHIVKMLKEKLGSEKGTSLYLQQLFPNGPRQIALLAGLPKPARCM